MALAGLVGAGRSEVARAIFGIDRSNVGHGDRRWPAHFRSGEPQAAMAAGMALVPEDRRQQGLVMDMGIDKNMALASLRRLRRVGLIRRSAERSLALRWAKRLQLKFSRHRQPGLDAVRRQPAEGRCSASGWPVEPTLLIIDEPTRGIDVGTKAEVHRLLDELVAAASRS